MHDDATVNDQCTTTDQRLEEVKTILAAGHALLEVQMFEGLFSAFARLVHVAGGMEGPPPRPLAMLEGDPAELVDGIASAATDAELPLDADFAEAMKGAMAGRGFILHESLISQIDKAGTPGMPFEEIRRKLMDAGASITRCISSMNRSVEMMHAVAGER